MIGKADRAEKHGGSFDVLTPRRPEILLDSTDDRGVLQRQNLLSSHSLQRLIRQEMEQIGDNRGWVIEHEGDMKE